MNDKQKRYVPCQWCVNDWIYLQPELPEYIGTVTYQECGDGCCWNRKECEECHGSGVEEYIK